MRPELLKQVFINLFDNWLKYGLPDQDIKITPTLSKSGDLVIETFGRSVGFDNNVAENLFELGFRSKEAKNKVAQGSGIGLYICKQIIESVIGGSISAVHQIASQKSVFRISIPKSKWQI